MSLKWIFKFPPLNGNPIYPPLPYIVPFGCTVTTSLSEFGSFDSSFAVQQQSKSSSTTSLFEWMNGSSVPLVARQYSGLFLDPSPAITQLCHSCEGTVFVVVVTSVTVVLGVVVGVGVKLILVVVVEIRCCSVLVDGVELTGISSLQKIIFFMCRSRFWIGLYCIHSKMGWIHSDRIGSGIYPVILIRVPH